MRHGAEERRGPTARFRIDCHRSFNRSNGISTIVRATSLVGTITPNMKFTSSPVRTGDSSSATISASSARAISCSDLPHNWMSDLKAGEVIEGRDIVIQFAPDLLRSRADVFPELADLEPFLTDALRGFEFFGDAARRGADLMRCIGVGRGFQRLALFFELIDLLVRAPEKKILASPDYAPTLDKETLRVVHDVISYIVDNLSGTIRMSEAAAIAGMKQSAFSRFFKKNTGANFVDYSRKLRIGRAFKLLSDTRRPVTDICFEVGYANISNFNRHFRKERGVTP